MANPVRASAPGKLYLAGEYAITDPGNAAIIAAVNRYLHVEVSASGSSQGTIASSHFPHELLWFYDAAATPTTAPPLADAKLVLIAMDVAGAYVRGVNPTYRNGLPAYHLRIDSELDDPATGLKYGLGSSGALLVAAIRAITGFFATPITNLQAYQLGMLASVRSGSGGSGGDIAASSHGGIVHYRSPDRSWLLAELAAHPTLAGAVAALLDQPWPHLQIGALPTGGQALSGFVAGWTSQVANTDAKLSFDRSHNPDHYANFIAHSNVEVARIAAAIGDDHYFRLSHGINAARSLLQDLARTYDLEIETPLLAALCEAVQSKGGCAKPSGAGGGDCGIGVLPPGTDCGELVKHWQDLGITPLGLQFSPAIADTLG